MNAKTPSQPADDLQHTHNKQPLQLLLRAEVFITAHNMSALCRINNTVTVQFYRGYVKVYAEGVVKQKMIKNKKFPIQGRKMFSVYFMVVKSIWTPHGGGEIQKI